MPTFDQIETALGQHLRGMGSTPIAWPNQDFTPTGTYIEFRHSPTERIDPVLAGGMPYQTGIALITVVAKAGGFATAANTLAQQIANRFPKALRLTAGSGRVIISAAPSFGTPFQDGAYWRQPVRVFYLTEG